MDNRPIGVFDSGIGGLTTVKELEKRLPHEDIIYFGDTGRVPYGTRSEETIIRYARQDVRFLRRFDIKAVIIACGTASSVALNDLKQSFDLPVIGVVEGAAYAAARAAKNKRIGVIGTNAAIQSGAYHRKLKEIDADIEIVSKACPLFVPLVENGRISRDDTVLKLIIEEYLSEIRAAEVDTLILGCTHYPVIADAIGEFMGERVRLINPGLEAVDRLCALSAFGESAPKTGRVRFFVSDDRQSFEKQASLFLGRKLSGSVGLVNIDEI